MATIPISEQIEAALATALLRAVEMVRDATRVGEILDAMAAGDIEGALDAIRMEIGEAELEHVVPQALRSVYEDAGLTARQSLQRALGAEVRVSFDLLNPEAISWIRDNAAALIRNFGDSSLGAIRDLILNAYRAGRTPAALARMIRESGIGLDARRLTALENYRLGLEGAPPGTWSREQIDKLVSEYAERLLRDRARLIARTETLRAAAEGNRELWRQAQARGLLGDGAEVEWQTTGQENVCPECDALEGERIPLGGTFSNGDPGPPAHPACSCVAVLHPAAG